MSIVNIKVTNNLNFKNMKNILKVLFISLLSCACYAQEDGADICSESKQAAFKRFRNLRNARLAYPGDDKIDVTYYKLNFNISHTQQYLKGEVTVGFKLKSASSNCFLDLRSPLKVDSVKLYNRRITFMQDASKVNLTFDKSYPQGQALSVIVFYQGKPNSSAFGSFTFATHGSSNSPVVWSLSEPYGAPDWFPCKDTPADKADSSDVWITMPVSFVSVSNGVLTKVLDNKDNTRTYQWKNRYPIAQYLISIACSNYTEYKNYFKYSERDSMTINHFVYPESFTANVKNQLDQTPFMLKLFSEKFGLYPFIKEKYGHVQCGFSGGMEHQTCSSMGSYGGGLVAHELAHQWFGDKITCKNWENIWLNEGFATYAEAIYAEALSGKSGYLTNITSNATRAKRAVGTLYVQNINSEDEIFSDNRTYSKGAMVLHMLRGIVGDDKFYKILQNYLVSSVAYAAASTEDFQKVAEETTGLKLDYFFKEWVYGEGYPKYTYTYNPSETSKELKITIAQSSGTNPIVFSMPVDIKIVMADGSESLTTVFIDKATQEITFSKPQGAISQVVFDAESKILKDVSENKVATAITGNEVETNLVNWNIYPNPADNQLVVSFGLSKQAEVEVEIFDKLGKKLKSEGIEILRFGTYTKQISLNEFSSGMFLVRLRINDQYFGKTLIVK